MPKQDDKRKQMRDQNELRHEQHLRRLGMRNPICPQCGEKWVAALTGVAPSILCYECQMQAKNKPSVEKHHFAGRHNDSLTVPIPGNDHRILSDLQREWPQETLRNPNGSPLLKAAASIRGWLDILWLLIQKIIAWIPAFLEWLDEQLIASHGERWWEAFGWEGDLS